MINLQANLKQLLPCLTFVFQPMALAGAAGGSCYILGSFRCHILCGSSQLYIALSIWNFKWFTTAWWLDTFRKFHPYVYIYCKFFKNKINDICKFLFANSQRPWNPLGIFFISLTDSLVLTYIFPFATRKRWKVFCKIDLAYT